MEREGNVEEIESDGGNENAEADVAIDDDEAIEKQLKERSQ